MTFLGLGASFVVVGVFIVIRFMVAMLVHFFPMDIGFVVDVILWISLWTLTFVFLEDFGFMVIMVVRVDGPMDIGINTH